MLALHKAHPSYEAFSARGHDDLTSHVLRESFRAHEFQWKKSERNDATSCEHIRFSDERSKLALNLAKESPQNFAILTGGFVSDAGFSIQKRNIIRPCPFCNTAPADTDHAFWHCNAFPPPIPRPRDTLLRRLGGHALATLMMHLQWGGCVRCARTLANRYQR